MSDIAGRDDLENLITYLEQEFSLAPQGTKGSLMRGLPRFYSYNNLSQPKPGWDCSCGHAAIASLWDFFNVIPFPLAKTEYGQELADDGRLHCRNDELVQKVFSLHPPAECFGIRFSVREEILKALRSRGLKAEEAYPAAFGNGETEKQALMNWLDNKRLPVLTLLRMMPLFPSVSERFAYHWGMVFAYDNAGVYMASWHRVFHFRWDDFMRAWHAENLPHPNNYYAIYSWRSA